MRENCGLRQGMKILDMAAGCGTFVFYGLLNGFDIFGVEPEGWKLKFNRMKMAEYRYPGNWINRFIKARGENLPVKSECFDMAASYQTLEHVSEVEKCLQEMLRIVKSGGYVCLSFPDYRSTFEGHYRLPWLPCLFKPLAGLYLKLLGRPVAGLNALNYVTRGRVAKMIQKLDSRVEIVDLDKAAFRKRTGSIIHRLKMMKAPGGLTIPAVLINLVYTGLFLRLGRLFHAEKQVWLMVRKCS